MEVLENEAHRPLAAERPHEVGDGIESLALDAVSTELAYTLGIVAVERQAEQGRQEGVGLIRVLAERGEARLQLQPHARLGVRAAEAEP